MTVEQRAVSRFQESLRAVREFFADPGDVPPSAEITGLPMYSVKLVARELEISETRAGDVLVELVRTGELMRAKHGRAFVYFSDPVDVPMTPEQIAWVRAQRDPAPSPVPSPEATPHADGDGTASPPDDRSPAEYLDDVVAALRAGEAVPTRAPVAMDVAGHEPGPALSEANLRGMFPDDVVASLELLRKLGGKAYCGAQDDEQRRTIEMAAALHLEAEGVVRFVSRRSYTVAELVVATAAQEEAHAG